jgi:cytoskeleton protein RodZ
MDKNPSSWSLGEYLRIEREKRGVTVEQMVSATKISVRLLHALENDQYAELPAKPFIRGFVVSYCRFLGVSPQEVLTRFSRYLDEKSEERPKRDSGHNGYAFERKEGDGGRTGLWILMGTMLAVGGIVIVVFKPSLKHHRKSSVEKLQEAHASPVPTVTVPPSVQLVAASPVPSDSPTPTAVAVLALATASPAVVAQPSPSPSPSPSAQAVVAKPTPTPTSLVSVAVAPTPSAAPDPAAQPTRRPDPMLSGKDLLKEEIRIKLVVKALDDVWVKFKVDQKDKNRIILRKGIVLVLFGKDAVALQASDPSSVVLSRSVGSPNRLLLVHGERPLDDVLLQKQGVGSDGRTVFSLAEKGAAWTNPFEGEPVLGPPPARPERPASDSL